ncbi:hypothetical protein NP493_2416g00000 [Ridgeia piscesae]|uniref:Uncharacterized protein n=1 Tax=Ridgeia piscesae TaxID=27915 RepID=A0AAD9N248_RIDPI|nr:hypothetical protein NP493_2416g00000 [Ridgeia piscesae]
MPMKMLWLASVLLCVSWSSVSGQSTTDLWTERQTSLMEHTLDTLQEINSRLLSMETRQQTIASRLEYIENRQPSIESRLESIESHVLNATTPPTDTYGNYTGNGCVAGRLLERAVMAIQKKVKESGEDEETNDDIAAQEARGQGAGHTRTSLESLLRLLSLLDKDDDEETSTHLKR